MFKGLSKNSIVTIITMGLSASVLLCGYESVRGPTTTIFKNLYGKQSLPIVMMFVPIGVLILLYVYARVLSKLGPRKTLFLSTMFSGLLVFVSYIAIEQGFNIAAAILYVFRQAYVVIIIEQYWSFINSTLVEKEAKVLNGMVLGISSFGAIAGGLILWGFAEEYGASNMLLFGAACTMLAAFVSDLPYRFCGEPKDKPTRQKHSDHLALKSFKGEPILILLLVLIVLTQVVSTAGELAFQGILQDEIPDVDKQSAYLGLFFSKVNSVSLVLQFLGTPIILRFVPLQVIHVGIPILHISSFMYFFFTGTLQAAAFAFLAFKAMDYSLFRSAKEIFYIPLSFDARYRAKEIIDVLGYRVGKGGISALITGFLRLGAVFSEAGFAIGAVVASFLWIFTVIPAVRLYKK